MIYENAILLETCLAQKAIETRLSKTAEGYLKRSAVRILREHGFEESRNFPTEPFLFVRNQNRESLLPKSILSFGKWQFSGVQH